MSEHADAAVTYGNYLRLEELLSLQQPRSTGPEHDEMLFIIIHQVYELWFKELLHELDRVKALLEQDESHRAQHTLKRILTILKVMVAQLDILETMTPLEFQSFRERLEAEGAIFQTTSDTECIVHLIARSRETSAFSLPKTFRPAKTRALITSSSACDTLRYERVTPSIRSVVIAFGPKMFDSVKPSPISVARPAPTASIE